MRIVRTGNFGQKETLDIHGPNLYIFITGYINIGSLDIDLCAFIRATGKIFQAD